MGARNEISGGVTGSVVQATTVHQVVLGGAADLPLPRQAPARVRDFVGRAQELTTLDGLLGDTTVVTIDGTAGVGKTTLVVWWAHRVEDRFPDGTLFANLRGHGPSDPLPAGLVLSSFLYALGIPDDRIPAEVDTQVALYRSLLAGRRVLVLLDNAVSPEQVRPLLPVTPGSLALVTSRRAMTGLVVTEAARRIPLGLFTDDESAAFVQGIVGTRSAELVRACARLPLALRVAATQLASRPDLRVADVIAEITAHPDEVIGFGDDLSEIRTVFTWSYTSLPPPLARTFRRLGLHPNTEVSVPAVAALTGLCAAQANRHLAALSDLHLVESIGCDEYQLHDLMHAFAAHCAERDETAEDRREATIAVLAWYARTASAADRMMFPGNASLVVPLDEVDEPAVVREAYLWLNSELDALRTALRLSEELGTHELTMAIAAAMRFLGFGSRAALRVRAAAETAGIAAARARGATAIEIAFLIRRGDTHQDLAAWTDSDADHRKAYALAEHLGDAVLRGEALCALGHTAILQERYADAEPFYRQALPLLRDVRGGSVEAVVHTNLSMITNSLGRYAEALDHAAHELEFRLAIGSPLGVAHAQHTIAVALRGLDEPYRALDLCKAAESCYRADMAWEQELARVLKTMALLYWHLSDRSEAARCFAEATEILSEFDQTFQAFLMADWEAAQCGPDASSPRTSQPPRRL